MRGILPIFPLYHRNLNKLNIKYQLYPNKKKKKKKKKKKTHSNNTYNVTTQLITKIKFK